jgi:hypothetical protein
MSPEESSMNIEDFELDDADPVTPLNDKGYCIASSLRTKLMSFCRYATASSTK